MNKYFVTIPVNDWKDAERLGSETNWKVLDTLRAAGVGGLTVDEISKKIGAPRSTLYGILSELEAARWVESVTRRKWGRPTKEVRQRLGGKPARVYIATMLWSENEFDEEFDDELQRLLDKMKEDTNELGKKWLSLLDKIIGTYENSVDLKKFFPHDAIHDECGWSHEAQEFMYATSFALLERILSDEDFDALAKRYKFMK